MTGIWKRRGSCFYRLLIGCLLFSILFVRMPSWAQSNEQKFMGEKSSEVSIEKGNPGPALLVIAPLIWEVAKLMVDPPWWFPEPLRTWLSKLSGRQPPEKKLEEIEAQLQMEIKKVAEENLPEVWAKLNTLEGLLGQEIGSRQRIDTEHDRRIESLEKLRRVVRELKITIYHEMESRKQADAEQNRRIASLERDLRVVIPEAKDIIKEGKEVIPKVKDALRDMKDKIGYIEAMKRELKELKEKVESLKAVDAEQTKRIQNLERLIVEKKKPKRKIRFALAGGVWFSESIKDSIIVYEGELFLGAKVRLFGGGGSNDSWISYYGLKYSFGDILSLGVGGLSSSILGKTELMLDGGISVGTDRVRLNIDYFYVPEEEKAGGTRVGIGVRF